MLRPDLPTIRDTSISCEEKWPRLLDPCPSEPSPFTLRNKCSPTHLPTSPFTVFSGRTLTGRNLPDLGPALTGLFPATWLKASGLSIPAFSFFTGLPGGGRSIGRFGIESRWGELALEPSRENACLPCMRPYVQPPVRPQREGMELES